MSIITYQYHELFPDKDSSHLVHKKSEYLKEELYGYRVIIWLSRMEFKNGKIVVKKAKINPDFFVFIFLAFFEIVAFSVCS